MNVIEAQFENGNKILLTAWQGPVLTPVPLDQLHVMFLEYLLKLNAREIHRLEAEMTKMKVKAEQADIEAERVASRIDKRLSDHAHLIGNEDEKS